MAGQNGAFRFDNRWIIDPIVNGVGRLGRLLSDGLRAFFHEPIIDGIVNGLGALTDGLGVSPANCRWARAKITCCSP